MASAVTVSGTISVGGVSLAAAEIAVLVAGVVLKMSVASDGSTTLARGFLL